MKLTGKCKVDFDKWLRDLKFSKEEYDNLDALSTLEWEQYPLSMSYGVLVDFFDSVGIELQTRNTICSGWKSVIDAVKFGEYYHESVTNETRQEARTKALEKANELYNNL
ncbi:hypothetical protein F6A46_09355 [Tenacibaculum finnmarkense genomovar ulcerans]|uniref:hypothetical protein n=1 Tax=Tenacibaculum finnmarkense TaxID=2781243 RepID=UPI00187BB2A2|nr:hypothetical protein [Tenacibaculum finnmarkense]MBE7688441.1 hypothetical protein [Tenacibaculum finnmarkense genomovar ulcerans]